MNVLPLHFPEKLIIDCLMAGFIVRTCQKCSVSCSVNFFLLMAV